MGVGSTWLPFVYTIQGLHWIGCEREPLDANNRFAVALKKDDAVIGHLPKKNTNLLAIY